MICPICTKSWKEACRFRDRSNQELQRRIDQGLPLTTEDGVMGWMSLPGPSGCSHTEYHAGDCGCFFCERVRIFSNEYEPVHSE